MAVCLRIFRARSSVRTEPDEASVSISVLNRHIHSLRKRIRRFEERFEQERNYKVQRGAGSSHTGVFLKKKNPISHCLIACTRWHFSEFVVLISFSASPQRQDSQPRSGQTDEGAHKEPQATQRSA